LGGRLCLLMADDLAPCQQVRDIYQDNIGFWKPRRESMQRLREFLAGDRYKKDFGPYNKDRRLVQIRGQETQDTIRHIVAKATERPRTVDARPIDREDDPTISEVAAALVEAELNNPWKGFDAALEAAITSCREQRLGVVMMDWVPDAGDYGEIFDRWVPPDRVMWDQTYEDPHHPLCEWFLEEKRLNVKKARLDYQVDWLEPDREAVNTSGEYRPGVPLILGADGSRLPGVGEYKDDKATLWFCWYKNDPEYQNKPADDAIPAGRRYMACVSGCGFRTPMERELQEQSKLVDELPPYLEQACDTCGGDLERIDRLPEDSSTSGYHKGKRLVIIAPFSPGPEDQAVYDGAWPIPKARSFPVLILTAYQKPGEPTGPCDVDLMWDQQQASDQLRTMAVQRVFEHRNVWEVPRTGVTDVKNRRWAPRDDQLNVMYRDNTRQFQSEVHLHQGTGLDPAWSIAFQATQDALTRYRPALDVGLSQENTRNIPVGTIERITHEAEVSTEHFNRRKNQALAKYYGVRWDYIRATYTPDRLQRLNIDGIDQFVELRGDDLPNFDFVLSDTVPFTGQDKARAEAFQALMGAYQLAVQLQVDPIAMIDLHAEINNLPRSVVRKFEKMLMASQEPIPEVESTLGSGMGDNRLAELAGLMEPEETEMMNG